ncbi:HAD family phosphatase [Methylocystis echinoides]|uniref:HAD family phosphatase n=1 Tax=Methylocystis echinoides TaxID=29468 RepID=UPI003449DA77
MALRRQIHEELKAFLAEADFARTGALITDLDGTAVHEFEGRVVIPDTVARGLKRLNDLGRPIVLNTLRFPLNVIRTFGREWYAITNAPLPIVSLNGSVAGYLNKNAVDEIVFEELEAFPLEQHEIDELLIGVRGLLENGVNELLVFYYARDWRVGETIWTPVKEKVPHLRAKYASASSIECAPFEDLRAALLARDLCMIFLLVEASQDRLMAYQHAKRSNFVTRRGVDKLYGVRAVAKRLGVDLQASVGCGDTAMDSFLSGVGLAVHVGSTDLEYKGLLRTVQIAGSHELGELLFRLAGLESEAPQ